MLKERLEMFSQKSPDIERSVRLAINMDINKKYIPLLTMTMMETCSICFLNSVDICKSVLRLRFANARKNICIHVKTACQYEYIQHNNKQI